MNTTIKNLLFVALGCAIGYFICWWMCRQRDCSKECKTETHCKDGKKKCGNEDDKKAMMWDVNCIPGSGNGNRVSKLTMTTAVADYANSIGMPAGTLPPNSPFVGASGGRIGVCVLRNLLSTIEVQQPNFQYLYFRLGLDTLPTGAKAIYPTIYLIGGADPQGNLAVFTSGIDGFCPIMCDLPAGN